MPRLTEQELIKRELDIHERGKYTAPKRTLFRWLQFLITTTESQQQRIAVRDRLITAQVGHIDTINLALEFQNEEIVKLKTAIDEAVKELPYGNSAYKILLKSLYPESFREQENESGSYGDFLQSRGRRIP